MSLLELDRVNLRAREEDRERIVLRDITLQVACGELVGVWGPRRSGRTSLLRVAAGIQEPDSGTVRFDGHDLAVDRYSTLGQGIGYVTKTLRGGEEQGVLEQVAAALLARGVPVDEARDRAREALAATEAQHCAAARVAELAGGEAVRVALARTLALSPALVVIDEPTETVGLGERDGILALLRSVASRGIAVLAAISEPDELAGFHRALTLSEGELRGQSSPELAPVVALRRRGV
jgi:ABC-type cobalamin/Fe3+-siderophores transport system ATPase subunit